MIAQGLPASPGAATGEIVFNSEDAETLRKAERKCILVRIETSPEDIHGMHASEGILTTRGGMTSHAAVVARGMGKPCVSGVGSIRIDYKAQTLTVGGVTLKAGESRTIEAAAAISATARPIRCAWLPAAPRERIASPWRPASSQ